MVVFRVKADIMFFFRQTALLLCTICVVLLFRLLLYCAENSVCVYMKENRFPLCKHHCTGDVALLLLQNMCASENRRGTEGTFEVKQPTPRCCASAATFFSIAKKKLSVPSARLPGGRERKRCTTHSWAKERSQPIGTMARSRKLLAKDSRTLWQTKDTETCWYAETQ